VYNRTARQLGGHDVIEGLRHQEVRGSDAEQHRCQSVGAGWVGSPL
jgi:hypothetical protein